MKHIPNIAGDDPSDVARWQESLKALVRARSEGSRITGATIPTGVPSLDIALVGGWLRGRIVEIFGPQWASKLTLAYYALAEAQRIGGVCAFVAVGSKLDLGYARRIGVNVGELLLAHVKTNAEALRLAELLAESGMVDVVVVDSLKTVTPPNPPEGTQDDTAADAQIQMMSQTVRKMARCAQQTKTLCLITSQAPERVGVMFGSPETRPGGRELKFCSSQRLNVRELETSADGCTRVKVKVIKNSGAPPFRTAMLDIKPGEGVSAVGCVLDLAVEHGIVNELGDWGFLYKNIKLGCERSEAKAFLKAYPEIAREIEVKLYEQLALGLETRIEAARAYVRKQTRWMYLDVSREEALALALRDAAARISPPQAPNKPRRLSVAVASCLRWLRRLVP
jgi:recombination protein RecA